MTIKVLYGPGGDPLPEATRHAARRKMMANAFAGARVDHSSMAHWRPPRISGQAAISSDRVPLTDRINDLARNNGWASAATSRFLDNVVGTGWTLSAKPDHVALGIERDQADEIGEQIEALWRGYAVDDSGFYCDAERIGPVGNVLGRAARSRFTKGEAIGLLVWRPSATGYATAMHVIDPQRVSNPRNMPDSPLLRDGVELDGWDAAIAYHVQKAHPGDIFSVSGANYWTWDRIERETEWGRPVVVHAFEPQEPGQKRGTSPFAPVLQKLKQITDYDDYELQAAAINALLAFFIETPFDPDEMLENLGSEGTGSAVAALYKAQREAQGAYYEAAPITVQGAQVNALMPGEQVRPVKSEHPNTGHDPFVTSALRAVASAVGVTYEQLTMDGSKLNYSSIRAMLLEIYRAFNGRKWNLAVQFMTPWYRAWLEEVFDYGLIEIPGGAPSFEAMPQAWTRCEWIGVGKGWVDPKREAEGAEIRLRAGITNRQRECAEQGIDWRDQIDQQIREEAYEAKARQTAGLPPRGAPVAPNGDPALDDPSADREIEDDTNGPDRKDTDAA